LITSNYDESGHAILLKEMFGCIEVELKPVKKVVEYIAKLGYDYVKLGKPKIVYTSNKVYTLDEIEEIFAGNWALIQIGKFDQKQIKKLKSLLKKTQLIYLGKNYNYGIGHDRIIR
jgi:hypothetical protein